MDGVLDPVLVRACQPRRPEPVPCLNLMGCSSEPALGFLRKMLGMRAKACPMSCLPLRHKRPRRRNGIIE